MASLLFVVFAAAAAVYVGVKLCTHLYSESLEVRLNPAHTEYFSRQSREHAHHKKADRQVVLFGDSRIAMWDKLPVLPGYVFINRGIGGDTTAQLMLRLQQDVINLSPDMVVIQLGINDLKAIGVKPERQEWIIAQVKKHLKQMTAQINHYGIHVLLMTVIPAAEPRLLRSLVWSTSIDAAVADVNDYIRSLKGDGITIIDCSPSFDMNGRVRPEFALDTLHLNAKGYEMLGQRLSMSILNVATAKAGVEH